LEDFFDLDSAKAFVFLLSDSDNKQKIYISEEQLLVIRNDKRKVFSLRHLEGLRSDTKKMLFPLIMGGIITPFAFLSFFVNLFMPWIHLVSVLGGMLLFYVGWAGKKALTIVYKNGEEVNYYLPNISKNVEAFIDFANDSIKRDLNSKFSNLVFFDVEKEFIASFFGKGNAQAHQLFPVFGYTFSQIRLSGKSINQLIAVDPVKAGSEIKIAFDPETNRMRPFAEQSLLAESQIVIETSGWKL
jgi:hypothetical protein